MDASHETALPPDTIYGTSWMMDSSQELIPQNTSATIHSHQELIFLSLGLSAVILGKFKEHTDTL